jgi:hypothetical protein
VSFLQQTWLTLIQTSSTALLVVILGGIVGTSWSRRRDLRRESFEVRTKLLNDTASTGQGMYVFMQHTRRRIIQAGNDSQERQRALEALDERFLEFSTGAAALQTLLGARFGVMRVTPPSDTTNLSPFLRWHQIHDLLSLYYYNLKEFFPGIVLAEASRNHDGNYHSGLDLTDYFDKAKRSAEDLRRMRIDIRTAYDEAMIDLARGITSDEIRVS